MRHSLILHWSAVALAMCVVAPAAHAQTVSNVFGSPSIVNGNGGSVVFPPFIVNAPATVSVGNSYPTYAPIRTDGAVRHRSTVVRYEPIYVDRYRSSANRTSYRTSSSPVYRSLYDDDYRRRNAAYRPYTNYYGTDRYRYAVSRPQYQYEVQYVNVLPHTGVDTFTGSISNVMATLTPVTTSSGSALAALWSVAATGIGAGIAAGKRFLLS